MHERKYTQIDEYTHPKYGHIHDQNYQRTYFDEQTRHLLHAKNTINLMNIIIQDMVIYTTKTMTIKIIGLTNQFPQKF